MIKKFSQSVLCGLCFALLLFGCTSQLSETPPIQSTPITVPPSIVLNTIPPEINIPVTTPSPRFTPSPLPSQTSSLLPGPMLVTTQYVLDLWWSSDSTLLYYTLFENGEKTVWAFNTLTEDTSQVISSVAVTLTPLPIFLEQIPDNIEKRNISISPTEKKAVYLVRLQPTPTLPPDSEGGEIWLGGGSAEVWLWEDNSAYSIGQIEDCITTYHWSPNEDKIVVVPYEPGSYCGDVFLWIIDIAKGQISVVPGRTDSIDTTYGISPNGKYLLYNIDYELLLMDLETLESKAVNANGRDFGDSQWIDDNSLLVMYQVKGAAKKIGVLDLESGEIVDVLSPNNLPDIAKLTPNFIMMSPDHKHLAISLRDIRDIEHGLWVLDVDGVTTEAP